MFRLSNGLMRGPVIGQAIMTKDRSVALGTLLAAAAAAFALATEVSARVPVPLVPTALVEDVKSATAEVEFMDYVGKGQTIRLEPRDVLVLSYLKSCEHETITGGTVVVGAERSDVQGGQVVRLLRSMRKRSGRRRSKAVRASPGPPRSAGS